MKELCCAEGCSSTSKDKACPNILLFLFLALLPLFRMFELDLFRCSISCKFKWWFRAPSEGVALIGDKVPRLLQYPAGTFYPFWLSLEGETIAKLPPVTLASLCWIVAYRSTVELSSNWKNSSLLLSFGLRKYLTQPAIRPNVARTIAMPIITYTFPHC